MTLKALALTRFASVGGHEDVLGAARGERQRPAGGEVHRAAAGNDVRDAEVAGVVERQGPPTHCSTIGKVAGGKPGGVGGGGSNARAKDRDAVGSAEVGSARRLDASLFAWIKALQILLMFAPRRLTSPELRMSAAAASVQLHVAAGRDDRDRACRRTLRRRCADARIGVQSTAAGQGHAAGGDVDVVGEGGAEAAGADRSKIVLRGAASQRELGRLQGEVRGAADAADADAGNVVGCHHACCAVSVTSRRWP